MFKKEKVINENAIKKDFFKKKKTSIDILKIKTDITEVGLIEAIELSDVNLPINKEIIFIRSVRSRPITDFIKNKDVYDIYILSSRINEKSISGLRYKIKGILIQDKIYEKEKEWLSNYGNVKKNNNHSKVLIFKTNNGSFIIYGSGNPSINARNEIYVIERSEEKYNAIKKFFEDV